MKRTMRLFSQSKKIGVLLLVIVMLSSYIPLAAAEEDAVTTFEDDAVTAAEDESVAAAEDDSITAPKDKPSKKGIYILPGFSASRLYNSKGADLWFGPGIVPEVANFLLTGRAEMKNDASGTGASAYSDRKRDHTGTLGIYTPLITSITTCLAKNQLSSTYTVEHFSFNWLEDVNPIARELAADIEAKGYESVILIAHSNGTSIATSLISQFPEYKNKIEKTILLGPVFMGSYTMLDIIEVGHIPLYDGTPLMGVISAGYEAFVKPISKDWMKACMQNNPNAYQILPGGEYISRVPLLYNTSSGTLSISDPEEYYALLAKSPGLNPALVNGSNKSLKYMNDAVYKNDILSLWEGMDVTIIGCESGLITAYNAVYSQSGDKVVYGGLLYNKAGDAAVVDFSQNGQGRFQYVNLPYAHHVLYVVADVRALSAINDAILGKPLPSHTTSSFLDSADMSDMIRVEVKSSDPLTPTLSNSGISVKIYDNKGATVAYATGQHQTGFVQNNFVYSSWKTSEYATNILCYIPKNGYKMEIFTGNTLRTASNITVYTETLDPSGAILTRDEYKVTGANLLTGSICTLDPSKSMAPAAKTGAKQTTVSTETNKQNWQFASKILTLKRNTTTTPSVKGPDASKMVKTTYTWTSSDPTVATVSPSGMITAKAPGTATITATARDKSYKMGSVTITVTP
ncbi:MAG: Ig-like domain-containing protein [Peptococcaceae bacterium]|nr:Ig-like domain-containing protein [Peptococcaceae bacterium]